MNTDTGRARQYLKSFDFKNLFVEELGWDRHKAQPLDIPVDGRGYRLNPVAHKRGMVVYVYEPDADSSIPDYATQRKIEKAVAGTAYEHIIIYVDARRTKQIWQWVKREPNKPDACRQHTFYRHQPGDSLIQKLQILAIAIEGEESLDITAVAGRARQAFDVDRITKR